MIKFVLYLTTILVTKYMKAVFEKPFQELLKYNSDICNFG